MALPPGSILSMATKPEPDMPKRREILTGLAASALLPAQAWSAVGSPVAISAARKPDSTYILVGLGQNGDLTFQVPLPGRGHAAAAHPYDAEVVASARRPGTFAVVIDCAEGHIKQQLIAPKGRHFYGHATFSANGEYPFTTENAYDTGEGRIGVWDRPFLGSACHRCPEKARSGPEYRTSRRSG